MKTGKSFMLLLVSLMIMSLLFSCTMGVRDPETSATDPVTEDPGQASDNETDPTATNPPETEPPLETVEVPADGIITTAAQLQAVLLNGDRTANYTVNAQTLDMTGLHYTPMGSDAEPYTGTFDFGNATVSGLSDSLFGVVRTSIIMNLNIADTTINFRHTDGCMALVVCSAYDTIIGNVTVNDSVSLSVYTGSGEIVCGIIAGAVSGNSLIENCVNYADFSIDAVKIHAGAIAGTFNGTEYTESIITRCLNFGDITNENPANSDSKVAGICGSGSVMTINGCGNYGSVTSKEGNGQCAGIFGWPSENNYLVTGCINTGKITGGGFTGGIVGYTNKAVGKITLCIGAGEIDRSGDTGALVGLVKNKEILTVCSWVSGVSDTAYTDAGNGAAISEINLCDNIGAATSQLNSIDGELFRLDGEVYIPVVSDGSAG